MQLQWNESFSVGVRELDDQHRKLIDIINDLDRSLKERRGREAQEDIIRRMAEYTQYHFRSEEVYLQKHEYPALRSHRFMHEEFEQKARELQERSSQGGLILSIEILDYLKKWLMTHILEADKAFGPFLNEKGIF